MASPVSVYISIDRKSLDKATIQKIDKLEKGIPQALEKYGKWIALTARDLAPFDRGLLRNGIISPTIKRGKNETVAEIRWIELDSRRGKSFQKTQWENFVNWMSNSRKASSVHWRHGVPNFFQEALNRNRKGIIDDVSRKTVELLK